jgi:hypothetical protein
MRITKDTISRAQPPKPGKRERFIRDDVIQGLGVGVTASGAKSFIFEAFIKGRSRRMTIGRWPDINLIVARRRAQEIRTAIANGKDPAAEVTESRQERTFGEFASIYLERHARPHKRSAERDEYILSRYIQPIGTTASCRTSRAPTLHGCTQELARITATMRQIGRWHSSKRCSAWRRFGSYSKAPVPPSAPNRFEKKSDRGF